MVFLRKLKCSGLFSYLDEVSLEFSNNTILVGPNNSGKSNLLRVLKLFVDSFYNRKRLQDSEISQDISNPYLEIRLKLNAYESAKVVDLLSFYPDGPNRSTQFYQFENREFLKSLFDEITVKLSWRREIAGYGSEAYVIIEFEKLALKLFSPMYSGYRVSTKIPPEGEPTSQLENKKLQDILGELSDTHDIRKRISKIFRSKKNLVFNLEYLVLDQNSKMPENGKQILKELYSFIGYPLDSNRQISFTELFGTILKKGIVYSSASRGSLSKNILDWARELMDNTYYPGPNNPASEFNDKLFSHAISKSLEFVNEFNDDDSNLPQFLLSLKNSPNYVNIQKFDKIKEAFEKIFSFERLGIDILLDYKDVRIHDYTNPKQSKSPKFSKIVIIDKGMNKHFPLSQVGSGIKEVIYLLTTAYGMTDSVVMLDEPAASLHPPMMRALMRQLEKPQNNNQFIIITHSPELLHYELFEAKGQVHYVKKVNRTSHIKSLSGNLKVAFEKNRPKFKNIIDTRIFFGKCIILTEGESDKNLLTGIAQFFEDNDEKLNLNTQDIIIVSAGGKGNIPNYTQYLDAYKINYVILADYDARKDVFRSKKYSIMTKDKLSGNGPIFLLKKKNLEQFMIDIDEKLYQSIKSKIGDSKPIVAWEFAEQITVKNPAALKSITELFSKTIKKTKN